MKATLRGLLNANNPPKDISAPRLFPNPIQQMIGLRRLDRMPYLLRDLPLAQSGNILKQHGLGLGLLATLLFWRIQYKFHQLVDAIWTPRQAKYDLQDAIPLTSSKIAPTIHQPLWKVLCANDTNSSGYQCHNILHHPDVIGKRRLDMRTVKFCRSMWLVCTGLFALFDDLIKRRIILPGLCSWRHPGLTDLVIQVRVANLEFVLGLRLANFGLGLI
jgi:hypothetical protein